MEQYIAKSDLVTELEKIKHKLLDHIICERDKEYVVRTAHLINRIISSLDTLAKEVDLDKEMNEALTHLTDKDMRGWFRYFFGLGLSASNPITAADRGTAEEIIINLKRVESDYGIDLTTEISWLMDKVKNNK